MNKLKTNSLLMVGDREDKRYFEDFFQKVLVAKDNYDVLNRYRKNNIKVIFLHDDKKTTLEVLKRIRDRDRDVIVVLLMDEDEPSILLNNLHLGLFSYLVKPFNYKKIFEKLLYINKELEIRYQNIKKLRNNYFFNLDKEILYNDQRNEVKLTKNEKIFLEIMFKDPSPFVSKERIEHSIWEEDSLEKNCSGRLKSLLNGIRKKLPQKSIINHYGVGYKINEVY